MVSNKHAKNHQSWPFHKLKHNVNILLGMYLGIFRVEGIMHNVKLYSGKDSRVCSRIIVVKQGKVLVLVTWHTSIALPDDGVELSLGNCHMQPITT